MSEKRVRSQNYSTEDTLRLVEIVTGFKSIVENKKTDAVTSSEKNKAWEKIYEVYNTQTTSHRTGEQLRKKYDSLKKETRKYYAQQRQQSLLTGGGPYVEPKFHVIYTKILEIIKLSAEGHHSYFDSDATFQHRFLLERCETLEQLSPALAAVARLVPWDWKHGPPPAADGLSCGPGGEYECGAALAAVRALTSEEAQELWCRIPDAVTDYYSAHGLNDTIWTADTLAADHQKLSQLMHAARSIRTALDMVPTCNGQISLSIGHSQAGLASPLKRDSMRWWRTARLLTLLATHYSQLFIPLAFEHMGNNTNDQELHGWIKNMERLTYMLEMKLMGLAHDAQFLSEQVANYKVEEDKDTPGNYKIRRPLLSDRLLKYQERLLSFRDDFGALCEQQLPQASQMFGLADAIYSFYSAYFTTYDWTIHNVNITDEKWQLEDQSNETVWVDTGCLQLLADAVDRPRCPLEELPLEASRRRRQCREQLWRDLVERPPRPPVTSYLAYSERAAVSLCLLAWLAANSYGVCQDVPFSITQSVHDATCYFETPGNQTCLQSNATDAICSVSRAILQMKCRLFSTVNLPKLCIVSLSEKDNYTDRRQWVDQDYKLYGMATERTLSFKETLNSATLKYKDFKVDILKPLEYSFIAIHVLFRLSTASVYMWLPHLGNLPGKILLSFQLTGLAQVLCSEVLYRMVGFPDLSTAALVDSCLTLLGCLWLNTFSYQMFWLNTFSYQMFACVRDLRLPDHLTPAETIIEFRRQLRWALIPWATVSTACAALEKSSKHYLMASRITFVVAISSSVALNLVLLGLVAFIYLRNKTSMRRLNIIGGDKGFSKKQLTFMSVNTIILSGICVIIRIGFHQATGLAQYVYYVHISTMLQGPVLFVFLACNGKTLPALKKRLLALWRSDVYRTELELGSAAERNLARRRGEPPAAAETSL